MKKYKSFCYILLCTIIVCLVVFNTGCSQIRTKLTEYENFMEYTNIVYGSHKRNVLDLCLPKNKSGKTGLVLFIHGGGWLSGDKSSFINDMQYWCKTQGYASASINYRYANGDDITINEILDDITSSLSKIKEVGLTYNLDIQNVMLCGFSAGAHLSLMYAYKNINNSPIKPVAVASFSGPTDLTDQNYNNLEYADDIKYMISQISGVDFDNLSTEDAKTKLLNASPINFVSSLSVPTIICHGAFDNVVPYSNAQSLDSKLSEFDIKHDFITFANSNHGLESDEDCWEQANDLMIEYANNFLK